MNLQDIKITAERELRDMGVDLEAPYLREKALVLRVSASYMYYQFPSSFYSFTSVTPDDIFSQPYAQYDIFLYVHIPFCVRRCDYCFYYTTPLSASISLGEYLRLIKKELRLLQQWVPRADMKVKKVYIGGGSPSLLSPEQIKDLFEFIKANVSLSQDAQLCFEVEPCSCSRPDELLSVLRSQGINFISMGIQTFDPGILSHLKRRNAGKQITQIGDLVHRYGFKDFNVDLLLNIPGQDFENWLYDIEQVIALRPTSISVNPMVINRLPMYQLFYRKPELFPTRRDLLVMRALMHRILKDNGYTSFFCDIFKKTEVGKRNFLGVDQHTSVVGLGPRVWSCWQGREYYTQYTLQRYAREISKNRLPLWIGRKRSSAADQAIFSIMHQLLSGDSVNTREFLTHLRGPYLLQLFRKLVDNGYAVYEDKQLKLSPKGLLCYKDIGTIFLSRDRNMRRLIPRLKKSYWGGFILLFLKEKDISLFLYDLLIKVKTSLYRFIPSMFSRRKGV